MTSQVKFSLFSLTQTRWRSCHFSGVSFGVMFSSQSLQAWERELGVMVAISALMASLISSRHIDSRPLSLNINKKQQQDKQTSCPGLCGSAVRASSCAPEGFWFDSTNQCFALPSSLSKIKNMIKKTSCQKTWNPKSETPVVHKFKVMLLCF